MATFRPFVSPTPTMPHAPASSRCRAAALLVAALLLAVPPLRADAPKPATVQKVKQATVYLRVKLPDDSVVQGSGFFTAAPGLIVTNAHVMGMLEPNSRRPLQIEAVIHSGTPKSKVLRAQLLGVDRGTDLALLRVRGKDLPAPLKLGSATGLIETQDVFIFGFPFGRALGQAITVSKSSVSSLRMRGTTLHQIQVNGGMHPGNSGGPVTDTEGQVVGVAVSGIKDTLIHFAIPSDAVGRFLVGRLDMVVRETAYKDGDNIKLPLRLQMIDPLGLISMVKVEVWAAAPSRTARPGGRAEPKPLPGDTPILATDLTYNKKGTATGLITLPKRTDPKQVYYIRPVITNGSGKPFWYAAFGRSQNMVVERKPIVLKYKPVAGKLRLLDLTSEGLLKLRGEDGVEHSVRANLNLGIRELAAKEAEGDRYRFRLTFFKYKIGLFLDGMLIKGDAETKKLFSNILRGLADNLEMDADGNQVSAKADLDRVPKDAQEAMSDVSDQVLQSMAVVMVPLPGDTTKPMQTWKAQRLLEIGPMGFALPAQANLKYTYKGVRPFRGKTEAVISVEGDLRGQRNSANVGGSVNGWLGISPETGQVLEASITLKMDMDILMKRKPAKANGELTVSIRPVTPTPPKKK